MRALTDDELRDLCKPKTLYHDLFEAAQLGVIEFMDKVQRMSGDELKRAVETASAYTAELEKPFYEGKEFEQTKRLYVGLVVHYARELRRRDLVQIASKVSGLGISRVSAELVDSAIDVMSIESEP